ncbi:uncharacterized protein LOC130827586 [Amaranthus tricolor]|uniref:uncharacterized protein LOC130827586 n=1 Tax=Amaranthus tricolor TaxID=29722 RepID=UPI00258C3C03|nr:uncharacterized protein LOC130827586 [Amaranthus tricolor]
MDEKRSGMRRRWLVVLSLMIAIVVLLSILGATVFKARPPIITVNEITLRDFDLSFASHVNIHFNVSLDASLSVNNPNKVGLKYASTFAFLDYRGQIVGEAPIPAGKISADQTLPMKLTLTVMADRILSNSQSLISDLLATTLPLSTNIRISGKVTLLFVKMNSTQIPSQL